MRVCIEKVTGKLIEAQSGGDENDPQYLQTLITNAINSGYNEADIEAKYITDVEFDTLMKSTPEYLAMIARQQAKAQAFIDNLPSWSIVRRKFDTMSAAVPTATNAQLKDILVELITTTKKLARVVYWLAKDTEK
jgi:hypothetical protein